MIVKFKMSFNVQEKLKQVKILFYILWEHFKKSLIIEQFKKIEFDIKKILLESFIKTFVKVFKK